MDSLKSKCITCGNTKTHRDISDYLKSKISVGSQGDEWCPKCKTGTLHECVETDYH